MGPEDLPEAYAIAVLHKDADAYTTIFDENIRAFDMWQEWRYDGITAWREVAKGWFGKSFTSTLLLQSILIPCKWC